MLASITGLPSRQTRPLCVYVCPINMFDTRLRGSRFTMAILGASAAMLGTLAMLAQLPESTGRHRHGVAPPLYQASEGLPPKLHGPTKKAGHVPLELWHRYRREWREHQFRLWLNAADRNPLPPVSIPCGIWVVSAVPGASLYDHNDHIVKQCTSPAVEPWPAHHLCAHSQSRHHHHTRLSWQMREWLCKLVAWMCCMCRHCDVPSHVHSWCFHRRQLL